MAKKEKIDLKQLSADELKHQLSETKEKLFQMRFQGATAPLKNPHAIRAARRHIARVLTTMKLKGVSA